MNVSEIADLAAAEVDRHKYKGEKVALAAGVALLNREIERLKLSFVNLKGGCAMDVCRNISEVKFERNSLRRRLYKL